MTYEISMLQKTGKKGKLQKKLTKKVWHIQKGQINIYTSRETKNIASLARKRNTRNKHSRLLFENSYKN